MSTQTQLSLGVRPHGAQLLVDAYFDAGLLALEKERLFKPRPQYSGHANMVPDLNDFFVLPHHQNGMALVHNLDGIEVISNVCRHRQATILQGRGNAKRVSCPMHRWTYENTGKLIAAPQFEVRPCLNLERFPTRTWHGLQFVGQTDGIEDLIDVPPRIHELNRPGIRGGHLV